MKTKINQKFEISSLLLKYLAQQLLKMKKMWEEAFLLQPLIEITHLKKSLSLETLMIYLITLRLIELTIR